MGGSIFRAMVALIIICTPVILAAAADADASDVTVTGIQIGPSVLMRGIPQRSPYPLRTGEARALRSGGHT